MTVLFYSMNVTGYIKVIGFNEKISVTGYIW